jgi:hippurate hydrolase
VKIYPGACVTDNDPRMAALTASAVRGALGEDLFLPMQAPAMASEDWAFVLEKIPGAMAFLGVAPEGCDHLTAAPYHSNKMLIEESAMANGVATLAAVAETFLAKGFGS